MTVAAIVGMKAEARLLPEGVPVLCAGGMAGRAYDAARRLLAEGAAGIISFGIAGALAPDLRPGALLVGETVVVDGTTFPCAVAWRASLLAAVKEARPGVILGATAPVISVDEKRAMHERWGALAVDLESGGTARACSEAGKPFAVLRAIADPARRQIPWAALVGVGDDGGTRPFAVAARLLARPQELPGLLLVALETRTALRALAGAARRLGPTLGFEADQPLMHD